MSMIPIAAALTAAEQFGFADPFSGSEGLGGALRRPGDLAVPRRRADRREVGHLARGHGGVRAREPRARDPGPGRAPLRARDRAARRVSSSTRARDGAPRSRRWPSSRRSRRAGASPRPWRRRSPTVRRGCSSCRSGPSSDHGVTPRARVHHLSVRGDRPGAHAHGADPGDRLRARAGPGMTLDDIDLVEINEAFASVVLAWQKETGADLAKVNVNGGAIALGHPLGATGTRLDDHAAARARAHRRPLRPPDDVRGRRPGQRDDHRAPRLRRRGVSRVR